MIFSTYGDVARDCLSVLQVSCIRNVDVLTDNASVKTELLDRVVVVLVHAFVVQKAQIENVLGVFFLGKLVQGVGQAWHVVLVVLDRDTLDAAHDYGRLFLLQLRGDLLQVDVHKIHTLLVVIVSNDDEQSTRILRTEKHVTCSSWSEGT